MLKVTSFIRLIFIFSCFIIFCNCKINKKQDTANQTLPFTVTIDSITIDTLGLSKVCFYITIQNLSTKSLEFNIKDLGFYGDRGYYLKKREVYGVYQGDTIDFYTTYPRIRSQGDSIHMTLEYGACSKGRMYRVKYAKQFSSESDFLLDISRRSTFHFQSGEDCFVIPENIVKKITFLDRNEGDLIEEEW